MAAPIDDHIRIHPEVGVYVTDLAFGHGRVAEFAGMMGAAWQRIPRASRTALLEAWQRAAGPLIEYCTDWPYRHWYEPASCGHGGYVMHFFAPALVRCPAVVVDAIVTHQLARASLIVAGRLFPHGAGYRAGALYTTGQPEELAAWDLAESWEAEREPLERWLRENEQALATLAREFPTHEPMVA